jgi:hypothetical protein
MSDSPSVENTRAPQGQVTVTQVSLETTGALPPTKAASTRWSSAALGLGALGLLLAPLFGVGIIPALIAVITGHIAKHREPQGRVKAVVGLGLSYLALVIGTAVLVFVAIPLVLAFLVSTGYIITD